MKSPYTVDRIFTKTKAGYKKFLFDIFFLFLIQKAEVQAFAHYFSKTKKKSDPILTHVYNFNLKRKKQKKRNGKRL